MKKATMALLVGMALAIVAGPGVAEAHWTHGKRHAVVKRYRHHERHRYYRHRSHYRYHRHYTRARLREVPKPRLRSNAALVMDESSGKVLLSKNAGAVLPIASISKLMTAMVVLDAKPNLNRTLTITEDDVDRIRHSRSRLPVGTRLSRRDMLHLALMSSANRAAYALSRYYPGGRKGFVAAMNRKARALGLRETHFDDPTGLTATDVSSPRDLVKLVIAAHTYPLIRRFTTDSGSRFRIAGRIRSFHNTNLLVRNSSWNIGLSKTGFINEAGKCLVMQARLNRRPTIIVLLDSFGRLTRIGDANRIRRWVMKNASLGHRLPAG